MEEEKKPTYKKDYCWNCKHYECRWCKQSKQHTEPEGSCCGFVEME